MLAEQNDNGHWGMTFYQPKWTSTHDTLLDLKHLGIPFDKRMTFALDVLPKKQRKDGTWPLQNKHPGQVHFNMERPGQPSRWNAVRALRVLKHFEIDHAFS